MLSAATWMDLEIIILSEVSQTEKDKYVTLTCGIEKNSINELIYQTETDLQTQETNIKEGKEG